MSANISTCVSAHFGLAQEKTENRNASAKTGKERVLKGKG